MFNPTPIVEGVAPVVSKFSPTGLLVMTGIVAVSVIGATCYCNRNATRRDHAFKSRLLGIESAPAQHARWAR